MTTAVAPHGNDALAEAAAEAYAKPRSRQARCKRGHELTGWNRMENNKGRCRTCHNAGQAERNRAARQAAAAFEAAEAERIACAARGLDRFMAARQERIAARARVAAVRRLSA